MPRRGFGLKEAMLSPGYRKFKRQFQCQCMKCGCKSCSTLLSPPKKKLFGLITDYSSIHIGFMCLNCRQTWIHVYNMKERFNQKEMVKKDKALKLIAKIKTIKQMNKIKGQKKLECQQNFS